MGLLWPTQSVPKPKPTLKVTHKHGWLARWASLGVLGLATIYHGGAAAAPVSSPHPWVPQDISTGWMYQHATPRERHPGLPFTCVPSRALWASDLPPPRRELHY